MFLNRRPVKILYKSKAEEDMLQRLSDYVESHKDEPARILARQWEDQQASITYQEIRGAIINGDLEESIIQEWIQNYSIMAAANFTPLWMSAAKAGGKGQPLTRPIEGFTFNPREKPIRRWVADRSGRMITAITEEQRAAVRVMIGRAVDGKYTVDELSRVIRPCIGLNRPQATANQRYYETIRDNLIKQHPRMKVESAQKQAQEMAIRYAERQHRQRAYMIAETELVSAYNQGSEQAVRQAQQQGKLGAVRRFGSTAEDERVCPTCANKHGIELTEADGIPPWHPRCRCAIAYEPTGGPYVENKTINEPEFIPVDDAIANETYKQIQKEWDLIPPSHQDILDKEVLEIRHSQIGNSYTNKNLGIIYVSADLEKGEFIHEAAHLLEEHFKVYQDDRFVSILRDTLGNGKMILDTKTFVKPIYRIDSKQLVSVYQGRAYLESGIPQEIDGELNPNVFAEFFSEGYKTYILDPDFLIKQNFRLWKFIEELTV